MKTANEIRENLAKFAKTHEAEMDMKAEELVHRITEDFFSSGENCYVLSKKDYPSMVVLSNRVIEKLIKLGYRTNYYSFSDEWIVTV